MKDYTIPKLAKIKEVDVVTQQVVINGIPQNITQKGYVVACPDCGRVIYQFPIGISEVEVYKAKNQGREELLKIATYCPTCGTKLYYGGETIEVELPNEESLS